MKTYQFEFSLLKISWTLAAVMLVVGIITGQPILWAGALFISVPGFGFLLVYFPERREQTKATSEESKILTHRCRLYRTGDGLTQSAHVGSFAELWDYVEAPETHDLPNGKLWRTFSDVDEAKVRAAVDDYRLKHNIVEVGDWKGRGSI